MSNIVTSSGGEVATMTSIDLLEVVNAARAEFGEAPVRRNDFTDRCKDELSGENYETFVVENANKTSSEAVLMTRDQCMYVLMRESKAVRRRVQDKLNQRAQPAIPQTFAQALRLAAEQQEEIERQQLALEQAKPKVVYADTMLNSDGTVLVRDAAKTLGVPVRKLEHALRDKGVILSNNAPAAEYVSKGYFKESLHTYKTKTRGDQMSSVARVTGKGLEFLRRFAERHAALFVKAPRKASQ